MVIVGYLFWINFFDQFDVELVKVVVCGLFDVCLEFIVLVFVENGVEVCVLDLVFVVLGIVEGVFDVFWVQFFVDGYVLIQVYVNCFEVLQFQGLCEFVVVDFGCLIIFGWGLCFLYFMGQYYKGGLVQGVFLQIFECIDVDFEIFDCFFIFGQFIQVQVVGDVVVFVEYGCFVVLLMIIEFLDDVFVFFEVVQK